uniref:CapA family protein n=1 Tax=Fervidicoccus fontis TaxID=683846 RepID=A0A7J3ZJ98_9CREN
MKIVLLGDIYFTRKFSNELEEDLRRALKTGFAAGNLEAPLCDGGTLMEKYSNLRISTSLASELKELGVDAVSLANNHAMDYGVEGLESTLEHLSRLGIRWFGAGRSLDEALAPLEVDGSEGKVCLLGVTTVFVPQARATESRPGVAGIRLETTVTLNPKEILEEPGAPYIVGARLHDEDVKMLKKKLLDFRKMCDLLVAFVHWGVGALPYSAIVLNYVRELGRLLVDSGVDLVVGGHPHILLPIEKYRGRFIIYSLGNFVFTERTPLELSSVGGFVEFEFESPGSTPIKSLKLVPVCLDESGIPRRCRNAIQVPEVLLALSQSEKWGCRYSVEGDSILVE